MLASGECPTVNRLDDVASHELLPAGPFAVNPRDDNAHGAPVTAATGGVKSCTSTPMVPVAAGGVANRRSASASTVLPGTITNLPPWVIASPTNSALPVKRNDPGAQIGRSRHGPQRFRPQRAIERM